jgi:NADH-quinone oxidoreductase subunit N
MNSAIPSLADFYRVLPELIWCASGLLAMLLQPFVRSRSFFTGLAFLGALAGTAASSFAFRNPGLGFFGLVQSDAFSFFFHLLVGTVSVLVILAAGPYLDRERLPAAEFYALLLFATAGMGVLASAQELLTAFIGLEMSSISSYILAGYRRDSLKSSESAMKYFLLGSFATAFFLYGIAMIYGATGTTRIDLVQAALENSIAAQGHLASLPIAGLALIFVGLGFKVVAAPFQIYGPDVYEGAPTPVTALLASGPKAATFALMLRIFYVSFGTAGSFWFWAVWISAVLTMFTGNLAALVQTNVKRMLAYSSIAHAGYILVAFTASTVYGVAAVLFYLAAYTLMKIGAFLVIAHLGQRDEKRLEITDYAGLGTKQPVLAACFTLFLLSLLGLPATGGFLGKFFAFQAALDSRIVWLVIIAAINSVIGAYYYLRVIIAMYFWEPSKDYTPSKVAPALVVALAIAAVGTLYLGILPSHVLDFAKAAADSLNLH